MKGCLLIFAGLMLSLTCKAQVFFYASVSTYYAATTSSTASSISASFTDVFNQQWVTTANWSSFPSTGDITFNLYSPNPNANIGSGRLVTFDFTGFAGLGYALEAVNPVNPPYVPFPTQAPGVSFDANDLSVGFDVLAAYSPYNSWTFQLVPVPEPSTLSLVAIGLGGYWMLRRRRKGTGFRF